MTTRQLRALLFDINNQEMTVKELRAKLFDVNEQDQEIEIQKLALKLNALAGK